MLPSGNKCGNLPVATGFIPRSTKTKSNPITKAGTDQINKQEDKIAVDFLVHAQLGKWQNMSRQMPKVTVDQRKQKRKTAMHT